jgi:hypothetical protein
MAKYARLRLATPIPPSAKRVKQHRPEGPRILVPVSRGMSSEAVIEWRTQIEASIKDVKQKGFVHGSIISLAHAAVTMSTEEVSRQKERIINDMQENCWIDNSGLRQVVFAHIYDRAIEETHGQA